VVPPDRGADLTRRPLSARHVPLANHLALAVSRAWQATASDLTGRASVIDGDTIEIRGEGEVAPVQRLR